MGNLEFGGRDNPNFLFFERTVFILCKNNIYFTSSPAPTVVLGEQGIHSHIAL